MNHWLDRVPRTMRDWLMLAAGVCLIALGVSMLPGLAAGAGSVVRILSPFVGGIVLAYVLDILVRWYAQKLFRGRRTPAILLSYLTLVGVVVLLLALVVPQLVQSITSFAGQLPSYTQSLTELLTWVQARFGVNTGTMEQLITDYGETISKMVTQLLGSAGQVMDAAATVADQAANLFISFAVSIYLLADKEGLLRAARLTIRAALPPKAAGSLFSVCTMANRTFSGYIGGQLLDALLVGVETFVLMTILGISYAPMIAVLVGVTNIIPVLGPFIGAVPGALILLLESPLQAVEFVVVVLVVQQIDGNFIAPRILGGATGLPGLGVLFAILVGGDLFGIPGMVVGVPTLAVLVALLKQLVGAGLTARGIDESIESAPAAPPAAEPGGKKKKGGA